MEAGRLTCCECGAPALGRTGGCECEALRVLHGLCGRCAARAYREHAARENAAHHYRAAETMYDVYKANEK